MSIKVQLATFAKRENSTAQFSGTWVDFDCVLKDGCSIITPRIELHTATNLNAYNYAYIGDFNRYYFIDNIEYYRDVVVLYMRCDVLATYKSEIGGSSEYILRSASNYDGKIIDTLYPTKAECTIQQGSSVAVFSPAQITFIIGVINTSSSNKAGAVQYLAMDNTQLSDLLDFLLGTDIITDTDALIQNLTTAIQDGIARALMKPTDYIVESYALPYTPDVGSLVTIKCGWWTTANTANVVKPRTNRIDINGGTFTLNLPTHPQAATRGDYLNSAPYTRYTLILGPFGVYPLDSTKVAGLTSINCNVYGDNFGNVTCEIEAGGVIIDKLTACVKNPFAMGQVSVDALSAFTSGVATTLSVVNAVENPNPNSIAGASSNICSSVNTLLPQVSRQGSQGNFSNVFPNFRSIAEHYPVVDDDLTQRGRPLCQKKTISSLSGYILVSDADLSISGTKEENTQIKNYMNSGFYYE